MPYPIIQRALGEVSEATDANTVALAAVRALRALFEELEPLIGRQAVRALLLRSLHLARFSFERPVLQEATAHTDLLAPIQQDLASRPAPDAGTAALALLDTLTALLASLIGDPLTQRLLVSAWEKPTARDSDEEKKP